MEHKKRILFIGEASCLSTGFSTYYRELIPRLVATGKYEIGEIASYIRSDDAKMIDFVKGRWKWWGTMPTTQKENEVYAQSSRHPRDRGQNINQFGAHIFDRVCAEFKPDIVIDIRDNWMLTWQLRSPFRKWFKWIIMPTVDAMPQLEDWMADYEQADIVLSYSDFGIHTLKQQSQRAKVFPKAMRPGVNLEEFYPQDKNSVRERFGISKDIPIIGTTMRNQSRKLFPDLIDAFSLMKKKYKGEQAVDKSVLLLHSCWPDNVYSYDYPRHIMRLQSYPWMPYHFKGIKDSILQTIMCHNDTCKQTSIAYAMSLYDRPIVNNIIQMPCPNCGKNTASCPTTGHGFTREQLAEVYNLLDLYVQCSICEGDGMPIQEAKACGVPTLVMDYTAMREKGRYPSEYHHFKKIDVTPENYTCHKGGEIIKVGRYYYEPETSCMRALPDVEDMADKMRNLLTDKEALKKKSDEARECVIENYDWNKLWKQWEFVIDSVKIKDRTQTWDTPVVIVETDKSPTPPEGLSDEKYIDWLYLNIMKYPVVDTAGAQMWVSHLKGGVPRQQIFDNFVALSRQQDDEVNSRNKIRATVENVSSNSHKLEFV